MYIFMRLSILTQTIIKHMSNGLQMVILDSETMKQVKNLDSVEVVLVDDNVQFVCGDSQDLKIYHSASAGS